MATIIKISGVAVIDNSTLESDSVSTVQMALQIKGFWDDFRLRYPAVTSIEIETS